jgi:hypothetical protein
MKTFFRNFFLNGKRYKEHSEAAIISCFFNSQKSPYRKQAFDKFYSDIKHTNHYIIECVIGNDESQLPKSPNIFTVHSESLLWHKESLLNLAVNRLPSKFKYIFWVDADVIFTNKNWIRDSVYELKNGANIIQPFEYCVHLDEGQKEPSFDLNHAIENDGTNLRHSKVWRSFCANYVEDIKRSNSYDYNIHGHVGFAWGARREILEACPLFDKALIGGADHIIAHAAAGQIPHHCIDKSFSDDLDSVYSWSHKFHSFVQGKIAYTKGNLYHLWHGDIEKRQYLKRIQEFTGEAKKITEKDKNGLYVDKTNNPYVKKYFESREPVRYHGTCHSTVHSHCTNLSNHHHHSESKPDASTNFS